jgi:hypothetical protein
MWVRLNSAVTSPLNVRLPFMEDGYTKYRYIALDPNKEYEYPDYLSDILLGYTIQQKYTKEREAALKEANANYEIKLCKVCGGKRTNIIYHPIEKV